MFALQGSGVGDIGGSADNFHFAHRALAGDGYIVARVDSLTNTNAWAKAGVMIRDGVAANAKNVLLTVTPSSGTGIKWRATTGGTSSQVMVAGVAAPRWLKLERRGNLVTGLESADGVNWSVVQRIALSLPQEVRIGLAVCSRTNGLATATVSAVVVDAATAAGVSLPWPWMESTVGTPADSGAALYDGSYVLSNLGADIVNAADKLKYVSQTLTGDGVVTVKVSSVTSADNSTRLGLMVRESLDANARTVLLGLTTSRSVNFLSRRTTGGVIASRATAVTVAVPAWLRLQRVGDVFTAWRSVDGISWTEHATETLALPATVHVGLAYANRSASTWAIGVGDALVLTTPSDTDGNGLTDAWETQFFGQLGVDPALDADGDGLSNGQEWELGTNPLVFNQEGQRPLLELTSGTGQWALTNALLSQPFVARVKDSLSGDALPGIPVRFRVFAGEGRLGTVQPGAAAQELISDSNGFVQSPFRLPSIAGQNLVGASIGGREQASVVEFGAEARVGADPLVLRLSEIGAAPALASRVEYDDDTAVFTLAGANVATNGGASDRSTFVWRDQAGDGFLLARVASVDLTDPLAQAGLMVRASLDPASPNVAMVLTPGNGVAFQWRDTTGGTTGFARVSTVTGPVWLLLRRSGDNYTGFYSTDGAIWSYVGARTVSLGASPKAGLTLGTKTSVLNRATFSSVRHASLGEAPWQAADIGAPKASAINDYAPDSLFVRAGGTDITGASDGFHYVYQPLIGDGRLIARVAEHYQTNANAKAALMIRESLAPGARHVSLVLTPTVGATLRARAQTAGTTTSHGTIAPALAPQWLKLERVGGLVRAYASVDGSAWTSVGSLSFAPGSSPLIGFAATSLATTVHTRIRFENIALESAPGARGWNAAYYDGANFDVLRVLRRDTELDFAPAAGPPPRPEFPPPPIPFAGPATSLARTVARRPSPCFRRGAPVS